MKEVKRNKRQREIEESFFRTDHSTLDQCYKNYSVAKERAYDWCREQHKELDELKELYKIEYAILSFNTFGFTYGGFFERVNSETGEIETWFYYSTSAKDEIWKVNQ